VSQFMVAQQKLLRVLRLITLLKSRSKTIAELAESMETTTRTIYRYLDLLEEVGFLIDKDWNGRYFIHTARDKEETKRKLEQDQIRQFFECT